MPPIKQILLHTLLAAVVSGAALAAETKVPAPANSKLDSPLFFEFLVGELSAKAGDNATAFAYVLNAARRSQAPQLYERAIDLALQERNGQAALEAAQSWVKVFPTSQEANRYVFQILIGLNRVADAAEPLKRMLASLPVAERAATISQLPRYFVRTSEKKLVAKVVEQALAPDLALHATRPAAWATIGVLRLAAADTAGALQAAQNGAQANPKAQEPVVLAIALINPKVPEAEALVRKYIADKPAPELRMAYTRTLLVTQRYAEASAQMRVLTQENPDFPEAWLIRGSLEIEAKKAPQAEVSLKNYVKLATAPSAAKAATTERGLAQAYWMLAQISEQNQKLDEALSYLALIESEQDAMRVQTHKAMILARQGKADEARAAIRNTPELHADDARTKINTEIALLREFKQYQVAYEVLAEAITRYPEETDFQYEKALMAEKIGKTDEMEQLLRQIIAVKPDHFQAYNALGYSLADRGVRLPEARSLINKALEFLPNDPDLVDSLAWLEYRSGNTAEALRLLQTAFKARPNADIAAHLGEVQWASGQRDAANATWQEGLKLSPKNETLLETMNRMRALP
jgi:tetratricopeptide (TPR) repeat protein